MSFNIGLTGLRAADSDLRVTGNNIANASTVGFKRSRAEFGDVYASSILGSGANATGSGVLMTDVAQDFLQGNISFTDNSLDLAISGGGFFILSDQGDISYSRAGMFSTDREGYIETNGGQRLQGFSADSDGNIVNGVLTDIQVQSGNQAPQQTSIVSSAFNLNSTDVAPEELVVSTDGTVAMVPGASGAPTSQMNTSFVVSANDFSVNNGTMTFTVNGSAGTSNVPVLIDGSGPAGATVDTIAELVLELNAQLPANMTAADDGGGGIDITMNDGSGASFSIAFSADTGGAALATIMPDITPGATSTYQAPINGYNPGILDVITATSTTSLDLASTPGANATAREIAAQVNLENQVQNLGISATAQSQVRLNNISGTGWADAGDSLVIALRPSGSGPVSNYLNITSTGTTLSDMVAAINTAGITGLSAVQSLDASGNPAIDITAQNGEDIIVQNLGAGVEDTLDVEGLTARGATLATPSGSPGPQTISAGNERAIGGEINVSVADGVTVAANATTPGNVWGTLPGNSSNTFDPLDPDTYNSATSVTVYDSLGNSHIMTQYYVKERSDPLNASTTTNNWSMYVLIDGQDVGNPPTGSSVPARAQYQLRFNEDGTLDAAADGPFLISNWTPSDANGNFNGSLGPNTAGTLPIPDPPISSNFEIDITGSTQFGSPFGVTAVSQDGYTTGRLSGLNIDDEGIIFARFTNGQAQVLGQIALAGFTNEGGLQSAGSTSWNETFESGGPVVGVPQTAALGAIQSGGLEESNVDISEELVSLIIAQRNYQSNAKTIETADQVTQTILNI